ncbi:hypothetical protein PIB30_025053 [Stylosanthes scabra]|uniref:Uncharacterized protein n=1 Tax=Stylosanthes scabra TaxID=79078 RepID=A0ABU6T9L8_9FABA|nr:hypothetical protein [Stylosanthes scabra]
MPEEQGFAVDPMNGNLYIAGSPRIRLYFLPRQSFQEPLLSPSFNPMEPYDFPLLTLHPNQPPSPTPTPQYSPLSHDSPIDSSLHHDTSSINSNPYPGPLGEFFAPFVQGTSSTSSEKTPPKHLPQRLPAQLISFLNMFLFEFHIVGDRIPNGYFDGSVKQKLDSASWLVAGWLTSSLQKEISVD